MCIHKRAAIIQKEITRKPTNGRICNEVVLPAAVSDLQFDRVGFSGRFHGKGLQFISPHIVGGEGVGKSNFTVEKPDSHHLGHMTKDNINPDQSH